MLLRDLLEKMLDENPHKRLTIDQVKKHPWFVGN
jgi:SNF-related kinase/serine kinase